MSAVLAKISLGRFIRIPRQSLSCDPIPSNQSFGCDDTRTERIAVNAASPRPAVRRRGARR
jgi:hypothetical protein